jgi:hypothetical protein
MNAQDAQALAAEYNGLLDVTRAHAQRNRTDRRAVQALSAIAVQGRAAVEIAKHTKRRAVVLAVIAELRDTRNALSTQGVRGDDQVGYPGDGPWDLPPTGLGGYPQGDGPWDDKSYGIGDDLDEKIAQARDYNRREMGLAGDEAQEHLGAGLPLDLVSQAVRKITIRSTITPDVIYVPGQPPQAKGAGSGALPAFGPFVRPEIEVDTPGGVVTAAPYGHPKANYFPIFAATLAALATATASVPSKKRLVAAAGVGGVVFLLTGGVSR